MSSKEDLLAFLRRATEAVDWDEMSNFTATAASQSLGLSRNCVSQYLNEYHADNQLIKICTRPVYYLHYETIRDKYQLNQLSTSFQSIEDIKRLLHKKENKRTAFSKLVGNTGSLSYCVEQCKAAMSYPPNGLPILLWGSTGTGKSMIAQLMYEYGVENEIISPDSRFITVNCSEYANNPELLLTNLFGYKKGAYTGAEKDKEGLISLANGGVLFLDEVHCLTFSCQEKLFLFMDKGIYHMVGDNDTWYSAKVWLIFATTENPKEVLLKTLMRRIPMLTQIPPLVNRPLKEKKVLAYKLIEKESKLLGRKVFITQQAYHALIEYNFTENVGQMVNCVRFSIASAFLRCRETEEPLVIHAYDLPDYILQSNNANGSFKQYDDKELVDIKDLKAYSNTESRMLAFNQGVLSLVSGLKNVEFQSFDRACATKLERYMDYLFFDESKSYNPKNEMETSLIGNICGIIAKTHDIQFSHNNIIYLVNIINDYTQNRYFCDHISLQYASELESALQIFKENSPKEYTVAKEMASLISDSLDIMMNDKMGLLNIILFVRHVIKEPNPFKTLSVIFAHGYSTASSMADAANQILGEHIFDSIDVPIGSHAGIAAAKLSAYLKKAGDYKEIIIMVDMGSLESICQSMEHTGDKDVGIINNVTTKLALDVGSLIMEGQPIKTILQEASQRNSTHNYTVMENRKKETVILAICSTGIATAEKISQLIAQSLPSDTNIRIISYDYQSVADMGENSPVFQKYNVLFLVGTLDPKIAGHSFISLEDLIETTDVEFMSQLMCGHLDDEQIKIFSQNIIKYFSIQYLLDYLTILNPEKIANYVKSIIETVQQELGIAMSNATILGLYVHISCLIERLITDKYITNYANIEEFQRNNRNFIDIVKKSFEAVEKNYSVEIPVSEIGYLYEYICK